MIAYIVLLPFILLGYLAIGLVADLTFNDADLMFWWLPLLVAAIAVGVYKTLKFGYTYVAKPVVLLPMKAAHNYKESRRPPTPSEVAQGMISTMVVRHADKWKDNRFEHKNIRIVAEEIYRDGKYQNRYSASLGTEYIPVTEILKKAIDTSVGLHKESLQNKDKYEKEQRILNEIEVLLN